MRGLAASLAGLLLTVAAAVAIALWLLPRERPEFALTPVSFSALKGWAQDDHGAALRAFLSACDALPHATAGATWAPLGARLDGQKLQATCESAKSAAAGDRDAREIFESLFDIYRLSGAIGSEGLLTGYYEPVFEARRQPDDKYIYPLFARPSDLIDVDLGRFRPDLAGVTISGRVSGRQLVPFAERAEIDDGSLAGQGLEIAWLADPFDAFLIHVQGSARLVFPDGSSQRIGFAGQNGHAYTSVGRLLVERGELKLKEVSVPAIRDWIASHPAAGKDLLEENARYVFFRPLEGVSAPIGSLGADLTARRSLAVDRSYIPLGLPLWLDTKIPVPGDATDKTEPFRHTVVAEDTGAAITGPLRGDLFLGSGDAAGEIAGRMRSRGRLYLFLPKGAMRDGQ